MRPSLWAISATGTRPTIRRARAANKPHTLSVNRTKRHPLFNVVPAANRHPHRLDTLDGKSFSTFQPIARLACRLVPCRFLTQKIAARFASHVKLFDGSGAMVNTHGD